MSSPSSSSHATVEAATRSPDRATLSPVHALKYPEYVTPAEDHPLLASASPIALSLDYSTNSEPIKEDLKEEPEEDHEEEREEDPEEELEEDREEEPNEDPKEEPKERTCFIAPSYRYDIEESSTVAAARQTGHTLARRIDYGFIDTLGWSGRGSMQALLDVFMHWRLETNGSSLSSDALHSVGLHYPLMLCTQRVFNT
nr:hypothetical protein [Tanacetum cinerariifolium]